jgi:trigger factor
MLVEFKDVTSVKKQVGVEIPAEIIGKEVDQVSKEYAHHARIPGFRKGKIPMPVVRRRFEGDIRSEVLERLLPIYFREAIEEKGLEAVGSPELTSVGELVDGSPLRFDAEFEIRPVVDLGSYKGLEAEGMPVDVSPEEVDRTLERVRDQGATMRPITDRASQDGDYVVVDIVSDGEGVERSTTAGYYVHISDDAPLAELREAVTGKKPGDVVTFEKTWDDDAPNEDVRGKTVSYEVTVNEVQLREMPELNDEFAKSTGWAETVADLRAKVESDLKSHKEQEAKQKVRRQLGDKLVEAHEFEVPEALIFDETANALRNYARMLTQQGIDPETANVDWEKLRDDFRPEALKRVKLSAILDAVAKRENLEATDEEVDQEIRKGVYNQSEFASLKRRLLEDGTYADLRRHVIEEKAFNLVADEAKITTK